MLAFRYVRQTRTSLYPLPLPSFYSTATPASRSTSSSPYPLLLTSSSSSSSLSSSSRSISNLDKDLILYFKDWFLSRKNSLFDGIFEILRTQDGPAADAALCRFNLRVSDSLILDILRYGESRNDVLSCLKFFDWAGRQRGFYYSHVTFHAIFRMLSKHNSKPVLLEYLDKFPEQKYAHQVRFYDTLVIGYAVAGKPESALHVFGRMRFLGIDLNTFSYNVFLNSLVEAGHFEVADTIADQIRCRGLMNEVTHSIILKSFCKQNNLDRAEEYLRSLMADDGKVGLNGVLVATLVDALCKDKQFERAGKLVKELRELGRVPMENTYGVWIRSLVNAGKLDRALEFLRSKKEVDGYVSDIYHYRSLVCRLLRLNRLADVFDLLMEMREQDIFPDEVTMNATVCFFCKAGMVEAAMELYDSSTEFGLSVNSMAYKCLIQTLFRDMSIDEACQVLKTAIYNGYFPGAKIFSIAANILFQERKLDKLAELVIAAIDKKLMLNDSIYDKLISAFCQYQRVEEGYLILRQLNSLNRITSKRTYFSLISSFYKAGKGDIAANLLLEMQKKGYKPSRRLFRAVVCHLCQMDDGEKQYFRLLEQQLSCYESTRDIYNCFLDGAGHAKKPQLAKQVYQLMDRRKIKPTSVSNMLLLQSFLKSDTISDALDFVDYLFKRSMITRRFWNRLIIGLCKACKSELALEKFWEMRASQLRPSIECYEELVKLLCSIKQYAKAFILVDDLQQIGRPITSFIGNTFLWHSLTSREVYHAWRSLTNLENVRPGTLKLGKLIHDFLLCMKGEEDVKNVEELIQQCFPLDLFTHNMLLRRLSITRMNHAYAYFKRFHEKGYKPNKWSYDIIVLGLLRIGQVEEARRLVEEMSKEGFDLTEPSKTPYTWHPTYS